MTKPASNQEVLTYNRIKALQKKCGVYAIAMMLKKHGYTLSQARTVLLSK